MKRLTEWDEEGFVKLDGREIDRMIEQLTKCQETLGEYQKYVTEIERRLMELVIENDKLKCMLAEYERVVNE